jgi:putative endonuclease
MFAEWIRRWRARCRGIVFGKREIGRLGESAAGRFLCQEKGYTLVRRNWRHGRDEIDLVCRDGEALVFVEVKTRVAHSLTGGYFAVNRRKKRALLRACRIYIGLLQVKPTTVRFDIVEVEHVGGQPTRLRHYENVRLFPKHYRPGVG